MTTWRYLLALLILITALSCRAGADNAEEEAKDEANIHKQLVSTVDGLTIWWAKPTNKEWTRFKFIKFEGETSGKLKSLVKSSALSEHAGNYATLDRPDDLPEQPEGFLLFAIPRTKEVKYAYQFDFRRVHAKGLRRTRFISCDFANSLSVRSTGVFWGILLNEDIRDVLDKGWRQRFEKYLKGTNEKVSDKTSSTPTDNSRSAPRKPESPPPAKPGSEPR